MFIEKHHLVKLGLTKPRKQWFAGKLAQNPELNVMGNI